jgi:molybdopterin-guanine dinucleotide biosynthesis protein A
MLRRSKFRPASHPNTNLSDDRKTIPVGIAIVAGGGATRLPGKVTARAGAVPMIVRVLNNVRAASREIVVASNAELAPEIRALVDVPVVTDREPGRGPIAGLIAAFEAMHASPIFALAADAPFVDAAFVRRLATNWVDGDEALVPTHAAADGRPQIEPLAALYDRDAFVRVAPEILRSGRGAVRRVVEALRTRYVEVDEDPLRFTNVNTPEDYAALLEQLRARGEFA